MYALSTHILTAPMHEHTPPTHPPPPKPHTPPCLPPPCSPAPPPVVIMAHGMGAQKDIGLWMYAERFCEAGMAVVAFDYRCFGGSEGLPRQWVSPRRHLEDFEAVVQHVQVSQGVCFW